MPEDHIGGWSELKPVSLSSRSLRNIRQRPAAVCSLTRKPLCQDRFYIHYG